ncbi:hypothetical protein QYE76_036563 [Lolium multiflorum]|uniref:Phosphatidylinositol 4-phosphate 5-kinase n=1 Tax=Lolium multiflorum TaxID=4521 RepID=A0AAD8VQ31_LOLMU|nr:hypothetical protein QYE76_036563 [Lolium multiflorum]
MLATMHDRAASAASNNHLQPRTDAAASPGELTLPNGDLYSGTLSCGVPEGTGRYVWSGSGCVYSGGWRRGMRHGTGRTRWPSGAVYEGEYSAGFMDGQGTRIDANSSSSYKGQWKLDRKHGLGLQAHANGDVYQGSWVHGQMEGHGRYTWANGNTYVGAMRNGLMSGKGVLTWRSTAGGGGGDSFQGNWLDGVAHGYGLYTWEGGGCYLGTWTRGLKDGKGTFSQMVPAALVDDLRMRGVLPDLSFGGTAADPEPPAAGLSRRNSGLGRAPMKKNASLQRRRSIGVTGGPDKTLKCQDCSSSPILEREYAQGVLISEIVLPKWTLPESSSKKLKLGLRRAAKRPGETIIKGHRSYDLMLCLQLGIRYTVGKITPIPEREMRTSDYGHKANFWMNFPKNGSKLTPSHRALDFKWKDYCPMVFRNLREMFKIDTADYMISISGSDALRELSSPGKSGSIFFLSQDDRFMIKTLRKSEVQVLLRMLPYYYRHVQTYENTLVTKFFGLHRVTPSSGRKFQFVVMGNMFCTELRIHRRFDLKGSSLGRSTEKIKIDENTTLKDLDLNYSFYLEPSWRGALLKQIEIDSEFLRNHGIMDYSLLLGFHYRARRNLQIGSSCRESILPDNLTVLSEADVAEENSVYNYQDGLILLQRGSNKNGPASVGPHIRGSRLRSSSACFEEVDLLLPGTGRLPIQLGVNMPARAEKEDKQEDDNKSLHHVYDVVLYIGIIDILQKYNMRKKIEHAYKSIKYKYNPLSISAVEPRFYSERFFKFVGTAFPENSYNQ